MASGLARAIGPAVAEHRLARNNLAAAFPDRSAVELKRILAGVWDNVARVVAEYPHLREISFLDQHDRGRWVDIADVDRFFDLRDRQGPTLVFSAHLGNWELPAVVAARYGLEIVSLFRPTTNRAIAADLLALRQELIGGMVATGYGAAIEVARALEQGKCVGLLVDQRVAWHIQVPFFGRPVAVSPLLARLAREYDCPIHGVRCIRLPEGRFRVELSPRLSLPRDKDGKVDVEGTMTIVYQMIEQWVREYPEQWLWLHDRWRLA